MSRILHGIRQKNSHYMDPSSPSPLYSISNSCNSTTLNQKLETASSSTFNNISQILVLVIISLALVFFISGLLHLLVRFLTKRPAFSAVYDSNRFRDTSGSNHPLQRQLQQLFRLHDSGLDQATIEALPVFYYKDIMGLKEPFDCAVCLCELSDLDKLRLLPSCSHAFHIQCIDTWLLSNSTCPLCRDTHLSSNPITANPFPDPHVPIRLASTNQAPSDEEKCGGVNRVFSIRIGKFRSTNFNGEEGQGETTSANLDRRRCYSMGTYQYVLLDSDLQVALSYDNSNGGDDEGSSSVLDDHGDGEGKRIGGRSRGDSFSVSKIWLWSRKSKFPCSSSPSFLDMSSSFHVGLPIIHKAETARVV